LSKKCDTNGKRESGSWTVKDLEEMCKKLNISRLNLKIKKDYCNAIASYFDNQRS
jgi:tRNA U34 2-thiouridine synthase MnmA/TrmU